MLGLVTIGQSPRDDVVRSMFGESVTGQILEAGALDFLDHHEIGSLTPSADDQPLVTRLRDGREVVIGKKRVMPYLQQAVYRLEDEGCGTICVLCTGGFPPLGRESLLIYPDRLLINIVDALLPVGTLGVLMPHAGQHDTMVAKWTTASRSTVTAVASPYSEADTVASEVGRLVADGAQAIVLDCMGFDRRMLADARRATTTPVILANGIVGAVLRETVDVSLTLFDQVQGS